MSVIKASQARKNLQKKGFTKDDSHHHYFEFWHGGKLIATTYTSHNNEDIGDHLIQAMSKQCLMDKSFFKEFIRCTKSKEDYLKLLQSKGEIDEITVTEPVTKDIKKKAR